MYAITRKFSGDSYAIVGTMGRFDFPAADGPILASLLDSEFPPCQGCGDRNGMCAYCGFCEECNSCDRCAMEDEDVNDEDEGV